MAIYHLSIKIISRGKGKSAVASAAYRAGEVVKNEYDGQTHDYSRKKGIVHAEIILSDNAPAEYNSRAVLWNEVERIEKNKNSQLAREIEIALPVELNYMQNLNLIREYVKKNFVNHGMCADICIHDLDGSNPHAHIMLTMRPFEQNGTWAAKSKKEYILDKNGERILLKSGEYKSRKVNAVDWNDQDKAEIWRQSWADMANEYLEKTNHAERIDHRSFERQGKEEIPTIHLGVAAHQMEKKGIRTERGDINRAIKFANQKLRNLGAKIAELKNEIASLIVAENEAQAALPLPPSTTVSQSQTTTQPPIQQTPTTELNILELLQNMLNDPNVKSKIRHITTVSVLKSAVEFLELYNITTLSKLLKSVAATQKKFDEVNDRSKEVDERLKTLKPLIHQAENYLLYKDVNKLYNQQKSKQKDSFYETHRRELTLYEAAERFLKANIDGTKLHTAAWKKEAAELTAEKQMLYQQYINLKDGTRQIGAVRRSVEHILNNAESMEQPQRPQQQKRYDVER